MDGRPFGFEPSVGYAGSGCGNPRQRRPVGRDTGFPPLADDMGDESRDIPTSGMRATASDSQSGYGPELALD